MKKDFHQKNLKNPFYKKKEIKRYWSLLALFLALALLIASFIYIIYFSPLFLIKNVDVSNEEIKSYVLNNYLGKNLISLNKEKVKEGLMTNYQLKEIKVSKNFPKGLKIDIIEREAAFILKIGEELEFRDKEACKIAKQDSSQIDKYPIIVKEDLSLDDLSECIHLESSTIDKIINIFHLSKEKKIQVAHFEININNNNLDLVLEEGNLVYFSLREDIDKQFFKLEQIYFEKINDLNEINYIDVRYGDRAFINYK